MSSARMGNEWTLFLAGAALTVFLAILGVLGVLLTKLWNHQDGRIRSGERLTHEDGRALAKLQAWREFDERSRYREPEGGFDILGRLARLEEFKLSSEKRFDEQGPVLRAIVRLEEQFSSFKREVLSRLDHLEERGPDLVAAVQ